MKQIVHTELAPKAIGPYSQAVATDTMVFTSGQMGIDMQTSKLASGVEAQAKCAMQNLGEILKTQGLGYQSILKTTIFLADMRDFSAVNAVYQSFFVGDYPARSCVQVAALPMGASVEIECIAIR
ncbi:MAG TPA: RidA family protein [Candidatus Limiplasma sp.]|nr:RidA family protein [Candidatus Limiplasma sp.]